MFQRLVSLNDDLRRLVEKGYAVGFDSGHLIVRDIPYLDAEGRLKHGAIVTVLEFTDNDHVRPRDHQVYFAGTAPHELDGRRIANLGGGEGPLVLSEAAKDVVVQRSFSNKPRVNGVLTDFVDFFDKVESYVNIISGPAMQRFPALANPLTFRVVTMQTEDSPFKLRDTLTSRAEIAELSAKLKDDIVAIVGLGGTGGYLLDLLVRTPVREIRAFDPDSYFVHNTYRSPGMVKESELRRSKAEVYQERYEGFRSGVTCLNKFIDSSSSEEFEGVTFAFVCVDSGPSRKGVFELLIARGIPFIDVGMGLKKRDGLTGMVRTTTYTSGEAEAIRALGLADLASRPEDLYRANIQIGELNALNACIAVIKFKQIRGFYRSVESPFHHLFKIEDLATVGMTDARPV